jgi:hypothetical protein
MKIIFADKMPLLFCRSSSRKPETLEDFYNLQKLFWSSLLMMVGRGYARMSGAFHYCVILSLPPAMALWGDVGNFTTAPPTNGTCADEVGQPLIPAMIGIALLLGQIISYLPQVISIFSMHFFLMLFRLLLDFFPGTYPK